MANPKSVMLVDDESHVRFYVKMTLKTLGIREIHEATTGEEAVNMYSELKPDLVLMDVNMPVMDGLEALGKINEADPDALVVMLTSLAAREIIETSAERGAVQYIRKDVPSSELKKLIQEVIDEYFG